MCFTLSWLANLLIFIVVVAAIIAILQLLIPWVFEMMGVNLGPIPQIIIVIAIVVIAVIIFVFDLIGCLGGLHYHPLQ